MWELLDEEMHEQVKMLAKGDDAGGEEDKGPDSGVLGGYGIYGGGLSAALDGVDDVAGAADGYFAGGRGGEEGGVVV